MKKGCFPRLWRDRNDDRNDEVALPATGGLAMTNKRQTFIAMKLLLLLTAAAWLQTSARGYGQTISLTVKNSSLDKVFTAIEKQSAYHFIYAKEELAGCKAVTVSIANANIKTVMDLCLKGQPLQYAIQEPYIIIKRKSDEKAIAAPINKILKGRVVNEKGEGIAGATVSLVRSGIATATDTNGEWTLSYTGNYTAIVISSVGYEREEIAIGNREYIEAVMRIAVGSLDEAVVIAYGKTTKRLNTGSVSKVSAEEIARQPVSNPLAALQGRVPGLIVTQTSGLNGAGFKVQLRGQNSLAQGSEPFYIIDGVPFAAGNEAINQLGNATSTAGLSPFNLINPADIESIEILKDADATAIYGSRGANGVILISTKKGKTESVAVNTNLYTGFSNVTRTAEMLETPAYLAMRREAFQNDGLQPSTITAPDLLVWDTSRYTDYKDLFTGGTATTHDATLSISGGKGTTQFLAGTGFHRETTVLPTDLASERASAHVNLHHQSMNKRFSLNISNNYSWSKNELTISDMTASINLPPHIKLEDSNGNLIWGEGGVLYSSIIGVNPLAALRKKYTGKFENMITNLQINYEIGKNLHAGILAGYNLLMADENSQSPSTSLDPNQNSQPSSYFSNSSKRNWITEPQLTYRLRVKKTQINLLAGATWQRNLQKGLTVYGVNYSSDLLLQSIAGAGSMTSTTSYTEYKYQALFGRINVNWQNKYLLNMSGRRDGSSRFGPERRFSEYGAIGAAWIFSEESFVKKAIPFISFGKLRGSIGVTGNDQIGDYKYIDTWSASSATYQGTSTLNPGSLFNPDYEWERNRKIEVAAETGILDNRLQITAAWFRNRCSNQIINYALPIQTGFNSIGRNLNALIENRGLEFSATSQTVQTEKWRLSHQFVITISRNRLIEFPGLASSSYSNLFIAGESVTTRKVYQFLGVDPSTGFYQFLDSDNNGSYGNADRVSLAKTDPIFFGGFTNRFSYKDFELLLFFEFKKQIGRNYLATQGGFFPGLTPRNQPVFVQDR